MLKSNGVLLWDNSVSDSTRAAGSNKTAWCEELFREIDASNCVWQGDRIAYLLFRCALEKMAKKA